MKKDHCKIHGHMTKDTAYVCAEPNGRFRLRCKQCSHDRRVESYYKNQQENIQKACEWKKANREHANEWERNNRHKDIHLTRAKEATRKKGINLDRYNQMLKAQGNVCAICKNPETRKVKNSDEIARLCIDHCHTHNFVRGLLCFHCNVGLGKFFDNPDYMRAAADYIESSIPPSNI